MRDLLRNEDGFNMDDLVSKMRQHRVEDKVAFKFIEEQTFKVSKENKSMSPVKNSGVRPVSEPTVSGFNNKKSINYRIKSNVLKR